MFTIEMIRANHNACVAALDAILAEERTENALRVGLSPDFYSPISESDQQTKRQKKLSKINKHTAGYVLRLAQETFAVNGSKLELDLFDVSEEILDTEHPEHFSIDAMWSWLECQYGGQKTANLVFSQNAKLLVNELNLHRNPPQVRGGYLCIDIGVRIDSWAKKNFKVSRLDSGSANMIRKIMEGLAVYAEWIGDSNLKENTTLEAKHWGRDPQIISRENRGIGEGVELVTTGTRFTLRFNATQGDKFRLFIAEHVCTEPIAA